VALLFGAISFLMVAVLGSLYLMAGYAMEAYVSDQIQRIPWDIVAGQRESIPNYSGFQDHLRATRGVERVEAFGFVRIQNTKAMRVEIDGKVSTVRWVGIIASSDPSLLPTQLRPAPNSAAGMLQASAAFVGAEDSNGAPFVVPSGATIRLVKGVSGGSSEGHGEEHDHDHAAPGGAGHEGVSHDDQLLDLSANAPNILFEATVPASPGAIEREEFNKWMLRNVGSLSYLPEMAIVIAVPMDQYVRVAAQLDHAFVVTGGMHGGEAAPPYVPEILHLVKLDRGKWVSSWELGASLDRLSPLLGDVLNGVREQTPQSHMKSDLYAVIARMDQVSRMIGIVTLLVAIPLLWLGWSVARMLSALLMMNERRLVGLALIRGVPVEEIGRALLTALLVGGLAGGLLGLAAGLGLPIAIESALGRTPPPAPVLFRGILYFALFIVVGVILALLSGRGMIRRIRAMRPREAIAYISSADAEGSAERPSPLLAAASAVALLLGAYKFGGWIFGRPLIDPGSSAVLMILDGLLNFLAVPFFLFGLVGLLRWRLSWIQFVLGGITAPLAGKLRWFVADHMALNRGRVAGTMFIASLAMSLALLPQVAADTFYHRILRGVQASVGGDVQLEYDMAELTGTGSKPLRFADASNGLAARLDGIGRAIRADGKVASAALIQQFVAPEVYLPNQAGLLVNVIESPKDYLKTVYFEEGLGVSRPFSAMIADPGRETLVASTGLLNVREVPIGRSVMLGYDGDREVGAKFGDILSFLPGQPTSDVAQREGYAAAEVDYLNYLSSSNAAAIAPAALFRHGPLATMQLAPSRAVFVARMKPGASEDDIKRLVQGLPARPTNVRWVAEERRKLGRDMFISLALANMNVFMIGGLILSIAGVVVVGLANFLSERRTFSLLRLRGLPISALVRVSLSIFLAPVAVGILLGIALGVLAGFGISESIWQLPRIYGVAGLLAKQVDFSATAGAIVAGFGTALLLVALGFALWPFRRSANENVRKS
jgi:hypothetical protein